MADSEHSEAWLEAANAGRTPVQGTCFFGRGPSNSLVLTDDRVSRRHAMIHTQGGDEFWLIDLGSRNGTYLNGRRIAQPCQLADQDEVEIGGFKFVFRLPKVSPRSEDGLEGTGMTAQDIRSVDCWLLVADIEASTQFTQRLPPGEAPRITANWLATCKQIIEENGGTINKFLGDGFLAYWPERTPTAAGAVAMALADLKALQKREQPRFRVVLHYGMVFAGGSASLGEESLLGSDVSFVFRMEKLAGAMGALNLLSEAANCRLGSVLATAEECRQAVPGFEGEFTFFTF